jgi:hypothetical protein
LKAKRKKIELKKDKKSDSSKSISLVGAIMLAAASFYGCMKKNVKVTLGFLKKKDISLVNLIIYMKNPDLITLKKKQTRVNLLNLD